MKTAGSLFRSLAFKIESYAYPILVPLGSYFVYFTGGYKDDEILYLLVDIAIAATAAIIVGSIILFRSVKHIAYLVEHVETDPVTTKAALLRLPMIVARQYFIRWCVVGFPIPVMLYFQIDLAATHVIPFLLIIPVMAFINLNIAYFNTENSLEEYFSLPAIRDADMPEGSFRRYSLNRRILSFSVSVLLIPTIIYGYLFYLANAKLLQVENIGVHIGFIAFLAGLAVVISLYLMALNIRKSTSKLVHALEQIKAGNFTIDGVPMLASNEIGIVCQHTNSLLLKLREVIDKVKRTSEIVKNSSDGISEASESLSKSASTQAAVVEQMSSAIEEMLSTVTYNADSVVEADRLAENSYKLADRGMGVVSETVSSINEISDSSKKIGEIITLINDIAFQTNLLALNAAVEAARAGEQGRGFTVVAGEVRNLAQRSRSSSDEIAILIRSSMEKVVAGTRLANESGSALKEIVEGIRQVRQIVSEISAASQEQKSGLNQITEAISQADTMTQKNAASAEQLSSTAETLRDNSVELMNAVDYFRV